jgi:diguanylate cyclase (GGDEF)-like protein
MEVWKRIVLISSFSLSLVMYSLLFYSTDFTLFTARDYLGLFFYFTLLLIIISFPMLINGTHIILLQPVSLAIFLQFGLLSEVTISLLVILFFLVKQRVKNGYRYINNFSMFFFTSSGAALVYYLLGGQIKPDISNLSEIPLISILGYIFANVIINHLILFFIQIKIHNQEKYFFSRDLFWEVFTNVFVTPIGVLIYILYAQFHIQAIFFSMIPVVTFSLIFRFYTRLDHVNEKLRKINESGNVIGRQLEQENVIDESIKAVSKLVPYEYCTMFTLNEVGTMLEVIYHYGIDLGPEETEEHIGREFKVGQGLSGKVALQGVTKIIGRNKKEFQFENEPENPHRLQSVLAVPLIRSNKVIGVLTIGHSEEYKYSKEDATLVEIIANQTAIALKNAEKYQLAKQRSEIDELTGLYNYRHFEHELFNQLNLAYEKNESLSLILLDIDYFKKVNDSFGHIAGNKILYILAQILLEAVGEEGFIARYGGEEFTILLPNTDEHSAYNRAEQIRKVIESSVIELEMDLAEGIERSKMISTSITVSVGLATYPVHADDTLSLIRHADRAMYVGAKRKGRNKVAVYSVS